MEGPGNRNPHIKSGQPLVGLSSMVLGGMIAVQPGNKYKREGH